MNIRPYHPDSDEPAVYALWQSTLGHQWPLSRATFHGVTLAGEVYQPGDHLVAEADRRIIGFVGTQARTVPGDSSARGELMLIIVAPDRQRQGIGRSLLDHALVRLKERGAAEVQLGAGGISYFWPGVPVNLPGAWPFFAGRGWPRVESSFDLVRQLEDYRMPPYVFHRLRQAGVTVATAAPSDLNAVLEFEARFFPAWLRHYQAVAASGAASAVVLAKDAAGSVVGTSSLLYPHAPWEPRGFLWEQLLGASTGGVGPLGVREDMQGRGIGLALAARVTELLQARGLATSCVHYTWLVDWYGKLGYQVWQEYWIGRKAP